MIPQVEITYSWIYDMKRKDIFMYINKNPEIQEKYPTIEVLLMFRDNLALEWSKYEKEVLLLMSEMGGCPRKEKKIKAYIVGKGSGFLGFSDPLTLSRNKNPIDYSIQLMIHELLHNLYQIQYYEETSKYRNFLDHRFSGESTTTKNHILIYALHIEIMIKMFSHKEIEREKKNIEHSSDYMRAWQIVEEIGRENIINDFKKNLLVK